MNEGVSHVDTVHVAIHRGTALIRVSGRGSFKTGSSLKEFAVSASLQGTRCFVFDMEDCVSMDSTFMGVIAGLALRMKRDAAGEVVMMNLSAKTMSLLETLGLDRLIRTFASGEVPDELRGLLADVTTLSGFSPEQGDGKLTLETMLAAHEDLVEADPANLPKFQNVIDYLSQDLRELESGQG